jgi:ribokinase
MRHAPGRRLAVTRGSRGVLTFDSGRVERIAAIDVDPVDATGAGDTFSGVLAAALAEGRSFREAVRRANAAAGLSVTHAGAREGMPTRDAIDERVGAER